MGNAAIDIQLLQRVPGSKERDDVSSNNLGSAGIVRAAEAKDRKMGPVGRMREREVDERVYNRSIGGRTQVGRCERTTYAKQNPLPASHRLTLCIYPSSYRVSHSH